MGSFDMSMFSFEKLRAHQESRKLTVEIYKIIQDLPSFERFDLGSQLRRAAISITSNIAEGCGRTSLKEKIHFLEIAYGSMLEVYSQILMCVDLKYINQDRLIAIQPQFAYVANLVNSLRKSYKNQMESKTNKPN